MDRSSVGRVPELDALRGLAALAVLAFHLYPDAFPVGWAGVDVFFVLSGYLVTRVFVRDRAAGRGLGQFWVRRAARVWPAYYFLLLVIWAGTSAGRAATGWPYLLTFTQGVHDYAPGVLPVGTSPPAVGHLWTLSLEQQFYLVWPLVLLAAGRRAAWAAAAVVTLSVLARAGGVPNYLLLGRCDGFALGGWLALAGLGASPALAVGGLVGVAAIATGHHVDVFLVSAVLSAGAVGLLARSTGRAAVAPMRWRPVRYLGTISYGVYLYQYPVMYVLRMYGLGGQGWEHHLAAAATVVIVLVVSAASWHLLEAPIQRLAAQPRGAAGHTALPSTPASDSAGPKATVV